MIGRAAASLVVVGCVAVAVACGGGSSSELVGLRQEPRPQVATAALPDAGDGGQLAPMVADPGGLLLVFFGFTNCPDICPLTMANIHAALEEQGDRARKVETAMVTVDPERDTGEVMVGYLGSFVDRARALRTDDPAALREVADAFGASYAVTKDPAGKVDVSHSGYLYAVDDRGEVILTWPFGVTAEELGSDLAVLLDQIDRPQEDQ